MAASVCGNGANCLQFLRLDRPDFVVRRVVQGVGPPDKHGGGYSSFVEGEVVAAPVEGEGGRDAVCCCTGLELGGCGSLSVYPQRFAGADHVQVNHGDGAGERAGGILHVVP